MRSRKRPPTWAELQAERACCSRETNKQNNRKTTILNKIGKSSPRGSVSRFADATRSAPLAASAGTRALQRTSHESPT
ncbi:hypothetical protein EVAR_60415_1 [Eumeta japonica]|uniref:Uncharacterized protein n=1 Tax=Eumeta variegata TaxID=151549 RepID=A0A4C1ZKH9_EUMVA|nr:hypothetical protein EVAR_60415_1 [Eumeta japonica]